MANEPRVIGEWPVCKHCLSKETVAIKATQHLKDSGKLPKDAPVSLKKEMVPLEVPQLAAVMVPCIVTYFDVCLGCGFERCTRAEIIMAPIQAQRMPGR
jgi:hypothetical protein